MPTDNVWVARHPSVRHFEPMFRFDHLPRHLQVVSKVFHDAAVALLRSVEHDGPELTVALRKLWEAKNSAVVHAGFLAPGETPSEAAETEEPTRRRCKICKATGKNRHKMSCDYSKYPSQYPNGPEYEVIR